MAKLENVLDKWIVAKLQELIEKMTDKMEAYDLNAIREIPVFIDELSTWYVRRSRDRVKKESEDERRTVLEVLRYVLIGLAKLIAPFMPFVAEYIYKELSHKKESVHLESWPEVNLELKEEKVIFYMEATRKVVEAGLAERAEKGIKVRQPLKKLTVAGPEIPEEYLVLIKDEVNVKEVVFVRASGDEIGVELDTELTEELKNEGLLREMVRTINQLRKQAGLTVEDRIRIKVGSDNLQAVFDKISDALKEQTLTDEIVWAETDNEIKFNGEVGKLEIEKV
jgi:isoleucyl-tRNA synthetase